MSSVFYVLFVSSVFSLILREFRFCVRSMNSFLYFSRVPFFIEFPLEMAPTVNGPLCDGICAISQFAVSRDEPGPTKRASAPILHMAPLTREVRTAFRNDRIMDPEGVAKISQFSHNYSAPVAVASIYRRVVRYS